MEFRIAKFFNQNFLFLDKLSWFISSKIFLVVIWLVLSATVWIAFGALGFNIFLTTVLALFLHIVIDEGFLKRVAFKRIRPYVSHPQEIRPIGTPESDSSFPSSHMASVLAIATVYLQYFPEYWLLVTIFVLLMAFSRLHNGMHYPSDVLAGTILGIAYGGTALYLISRLA